MMEPDEYLSVILKGLGDDYGPDAVFVAAHSLWPALPIPGSPSPAHGTDTQIAAGNRRATDDVGRFGVKSAKARVLRVVAEHEEGLTAHEAAGIAIGCTVTVAAHEGVRPRVSELVRAGMLADSGQRRCNTGSRDDAIVYTITPAGAGALLMLDATGWSKAKPS